MVQANQPKRLNLPDLDFHDNPLETIVGVIATSGFVLESKPLSLMLIADTDRGKSYTVKRFLLNPSLKSPTHATRWGLLAQLKEWAEAKETPTHVAFLDWTNILTNAPGEVAALRSTIMDLVEDGLSSYRSKMLEFVPRKYPDQLYFSQRYLKVGAILPMTRDDYFAKSTKMSSDGFSSRFVNFSYSLTAKAEAVIGDSIADDKPMIPIMLPKLKMGTRVQCDSHFVKHTALWASPKFRSKVQARMLLRAVALKNGRTKVDMTDVAELDFLTKWINNDAFTPL